MYIVIYIGTSLVIYSVPFGMCHGICLAMYVVSFIVMCIVI